MSFLFTILLLIFSTISAYITFLFTSSLASSGNLLAFAALGLAFDALKCCLPSAAIIFFESRRWFYFANCVLVCLLLISFSLFASFNLFDNATTATNRKNETSYIIKEKQISALEKQRDIYFSNDMATKATPIIEKIEGLQKDLLQMKAPKSAGENFDLIANIVLSILLELSIFSCHFARRCSTKKSTNIHSQNSGAKRAQLQRASGAGEISKRNANAAKSALNQLPIDELAMLIYSRGDGALTYRELEKKYNITSSKIKSIKDFISVEMGEKIAPLALVK